VRISNGRKNPGSNGIEDIRRKKKKKREERRGAEKK